MKMPNQDRSKEPSLYIVILKISRQIPIINFGIQTNGQELELQIIYGFRQNGGFFHEKEFNQHAKGGGQLINL